MPPPYVSPLKEAPHAQAAQEFSAAVAFRAPREQREQECQARALRAMFCLQPANREIAASARAARGAQEGSRPRHGDAPPDLEGRAASPLPRQRASATPALPVAAARGSRRLSSQRVQSRCCRAGGAMTRCCPEAQLQPPRQAGGIQQEAPEQMRSECSRSRSAIPQQRRAARQTSAPPGQRVTRSLPAGYDSRLRRITSICVKRIRRHNVGRVPRSPVCEDIACRPSFRATGANAHRPSGHYGGLPTRKCPVLAE